jgi:hypothetical protein
MDLQSLINIAVSCGLPGFGVDAIPGLLQGCPHCRKVYKRALDHLAVTKPDNNWSCWAGYQLWLDHASPAEIASDRSLLEDAK